MSTETKITLRDVVDDLVTFSDTLGGLEEGTPEYEQALAEFTAGITRGAEKIDRFAGFLRRLTAEQKYLDAEVVRIERRSQALTGLEDRLKRYALHVLTEAGVRKVSGKTSTLALRKNPDSVEILEEAAIPPQYKIVRTTVAPDRRSIMDGLRAGDDIPGARIKVGGDRLDVS